MAVAVRESLHLAFANIAVLVNPAYLLVDASVRSGGLSFQALFVLAPEKVVALAIFERGGIDSARCILAAMLGGLVPLRLESLDTLY